MHLLKLLALPLPLVHAVVHLTTLTYEPFDVITSPPFPWEELPKMIVPEKTKITLQMPLAYGDQDAYEQRILTSHDPESPEYGRYIGPEELALLLGPTKETYETVVAWLELFGIPEKDLKLEYDWLSFQTTVDMAEKLLKAKYKFFVNRKNGDQITLRCLGYSLPREVRGIVRFVQPTTLFATRIGVEQEKMEEGGREEEEEKK